MKEYHCTICGNIYDEEPGDEAEYKGLSSFYNPRNEQVEIGLIFKAFKRLSLQTNASDILKY
jgi:hypothetical protein